MTGGVSLTTDGSLENVKIEKEKVHTSTDYFCAYDGIIEYFCTKIEKL